MAKEIEVKGQRFRLNGLNAMKQLHVSRRLTPMLAAAAPALIPVLTQGNRPDMVQLGAALGPVADVLAQMPDAEFEYIVATCLASVHGTTANSDAWGPLYIGTTCMRSDLTAEMTLTLTIRVINEDLGPFIAGFLTSQSPEEPEPARAQ